MMVGINESGKELIELLKSKGYNKAQNVVNAILETKVFRRLKDISYLSSISYAFPEIRDFSRWDHSIGTAHLIGLVLIKNDIGEDILVKGVIAGLLHDIGNVFFSHVGEAVIFEKHNLDQHKLRNRIIESKEISTILEKFGIRPYEIIYAKHDFEVLLDSHFDCDTLDGISRTAEAIGWDKVDWKKVLPPLLEIKDGQWQWKSNALPFLKKHWELKNRIYSEYVYSPVNQVCEAFIENMLAILSPEDLMLTEREIITAVKLHPAANEMLELLETKNHYFQEDLTDYFENTSQFEMFRRAVLNSENVKDDLYLRIQTQKIFHQWKPTTIPKHWRDLEREVKKCYSQKILYESFIKPTNKGLVKERLTNYLQTFEKKKDIPIRFVSLFEEVGSKTYPFGTLTLATILENNFFSDITYHEYLIQYCDRVNPSVPFNRHGLAPSPWDVEYAIYNNFSSNEPQFREAKSNPVFLIGPIFTCYIQELIYLASKIREIRKDAIIIAGGPHFGKNTEMDIDLLERCEALDGIVIGEAEETLLEIMNQRADCKTREAFCNEVATHCIKGFLVRNVKFEGRDEISDLDSITPPDLDLVHSSSPFFRYYLSDRRNPYMMTSMGFVNDAYGGGTTMDDMHLFVDPYHSPGYRELRGGESYTPKFGFGVINGSRGCPFNCSFCSSHGTRRTRSAKHIFDEILHVHNAFGIKLFVFFDPLFMTSNPKEIERVKKLCDLLINSGLNESVVFQIEIRADVIMRLDDSLLTQLFLAGCSVINLGLEKGSNQALSRIDKKMSVEDHFSAIRKLRQSAENADRDILINGTFIIGGPSETLQDIKETIIHAFKLDLDGLAIFPLEIHPATKDYEIAIRSGVIEQGIIPYLNLKMYPLFFSEDVSKELLIEIGKKIDDVIEDLKHCRDQVNTLGIEQRKILPRMAEITKSASDKMPILENSDRYARWFQKLLKRCLATSWLTNQFESSLVKFPEISKEIQVLESQLTKIRKQNHGHHTGDYSEGSLEYACSNLLQSFNAARKIIEQ